jgi:hypothetical protein
MKEKILTLDGIVFVVSFTLLVILGLLQTLGTRSVIG